MAETNDEVLKYSGKLRLKIAKKTKNIEANIIACLWGNPELFLDYDYLNSDKFKTPMWRFYYTIGKKISDTGIRIIGESDVDLFLEGLEEKVREKTIETYNNFGGYDVIADLQEVCNEDNVETYIDNLIKWSNLYDIVDKFTIDDKLFETFEQGTSEDIYDYFNVQLNDSFIKKEDDYIATPLGSDLDRIIKDANEGKNIGTPINSPIVNQEIGGLQLGQTYLIGGGSGTGKTTWLLDCVLPALIRDGRRVVMMLNEQDYDKLTQQMITYFINNVVITDPNKKFSSKRWREGHFTDEEMEYIREASSILTKLKDEKKIIIIELKTYLRKNVERIIKRYAKLGYQYFFLDTLKVDSSDSSDQAWLSLMKDVEAYSNLVKPVNLNVHLTCTMQLQKLNKSVRYLDNSCIGMSKSVIDTASVVILFRKILQDEMPDQKRAIKVMQPIPNTQASQEFKMNPLAHYQVMFITKNRQGMAEDYQIVCQQELGYLEYKEIGKCNVMPD